MRFTVKFLVLAWVVLFHQSLFSNTSPPSMLHFQHDLHINDEELECLDCHPSEVEDSKLASDWLVPSEEACMVCHDDWKEEGQCETCHIGEQPYVSRLPESSNFMFSHVTHLAQAELDCEVCHGDMVDVSNFPPIPQMKACISCHLENEQSTSCQTCHEPSYVLRPKDHTPDWILEHDIAALTEASDCLQCHVQISCDNCHSGSKLSFDDFGDVNPVSIYRKDLMGKTQMIQRVHELNYAYTHGMDADTKAFDCGTCHEAQTFCTDCHQNSVNSILNKPDFHKGLDWGAVDYPPGTDFENNFDGGIHAELARRDIERCQACHDIDGGDPTCVRCHVDTDGIRFTNPQTHRPGFMLDVNGDWHDNEASLCYVCHTKEDKKEDGFCAYCH